MLWAGFELLRTRKTRSADRLEELQAHAMAGATRQPRRNGGGFFNSFLYSDQRHRRAAKTGCTELKRNWPRPASGNRQALAVYTIVPIGLLSLMLAATMHTCSATTPSSQRFAGLVAAFLLGMAFCRSRCCTAWSSATARKLQDALPDTVDLLGIVLGTGLALDQAMLRVSRGNAVHLSRTRRRIFHRRHAGESRPGTREALQQLVRRTGIEDIKSLSAMIIQSERFGTSLSQALKVYADALRTRRRLRARQPSAKPASRCCSPSCFHPARAFRDHAGARPAERVEQPARRYRRFLLQRSGAQRDSRAYQRKHPGRRPDNRVRRQCSATRRRIRSR